MSDSSFSRRDLLHLGGRLLLSVGAAKIVIALPGCGDDDSGHQPMPDAKQLDAAGYDYYPGYVALDDCHSVGTYEYNYVYSGTTQYTYHYYWTNAYGCAYYVRPPTTVHCYP